MKKAYRKLFSPWDMLIIAAAAAVVLCWAVFSLFSTSKDLTLNIRINGELWRQVELTEETREEIALENGGHHALVRIENGEVSFACSDCPDKLCVEQGKISRAGQSIVCLPGRFSVFIESSEGEEGKEEGLDAVLH